MNIWEKYWRLTIKEYLWVNKNYQKYFLCECNCWNFKKVMWQHLKNWSIKSCWCITKKHWMSKTRFYRLWKWAKARCEDRNNPDFNYYWWKWVKFYWSDFIDFRNDMYASYLEHIWIHWEENTTIDRIDWDWDYCKENCRWATRRVQTINRPNTIIYNWKSLREWCNILWLKYQTTWNRIQVQWKDIKDVLWFENICKDA